MVRRFTALGLLVASAAAIAARRADVFTVPQFWAEDGMEWYARAYNEPGLANLIAPYGGYLQLFPRIAGWLSQLVPFAAAPLLMAILALCVQAIAPVFLLTDRFAWGVPSRLARCALAILVIPHERRHSPTSRTGKARRFRQRRPSRFVRRNE